MEKHKVFAMKFANLYPLYIGKAERKKRTKEEVDQIICWLTSYNIAGLQHQIAQGNDLETFFCAGTSLKSKQFTHQRCSMWCPCRRS